MIGTIEVMVDRFAPLTIALAATSLLVLCGCGEDASEDDAAKKDESTCASGQLKEDGTCCPEGKFYDFDSDACLQAGPVCADASRGAAGCSPRWCFDLKAEHGRPCKKDERGSKSHCKAGFVRSETKPHACVPAGHFPGSGIPADWRPLEDALPPVADDGPWPKLTKLPPVNYALPFASGCPPGFISKAGVCVADPKDCPVDIYGDPALKDGPHVRFVNAATGSDKHPGTRAEPLATLQAAVKLADQSAYTTIAIAPGTYAAGIETTKTIKWLGRCAADVKLTGKPGKDILRVFDKTIIRGIHFSGPARGVTLATVNGGTIERVWLDGLTSAGLTILTQYGDATVSSVVVSNMQPDPAGQLLAAIGVLQSYVSMTDVAIFKAIRHGMLVSKDAEVTAKRLFINDVRSDNETYASGLAAVGTGEIDVQHCRITRATLVAVIADGKNARLRVSDCLVDNVRYGGKSQDTASGVLAFRGGDVSLTNTRVHRALAAGVGARFNQSSLTAFNVLIDNTQMSVDNKVGLGATTAEGSTLTLIDSRLSRNYKQGLQVFGKGTHAVLNRVLIDNTRAVPASKRHGIGVIAAQSAKITASDLRISASDNAGLVVLEPGTVFTGTRVVVDNTNQTMGPGGTPAGVVCGNQYNEVGDVYCTFNGARISGATGAGMVMAGTGLFAQLRGVLVDGTRAAAVNTAYPKEEPLAGLGIISTGGTDVVVSGSVFRGNRLVSLLFRNRRAFTFDQRRVEFQAGGRLRVFGSVVAATAKSDDGGYGAGLWCDGMEGGCEIHASHMANNFTSGVLIRDGNGVVRDSVITQTLPGNVYERGNTFAVADGLVIDSSVVDVARTLVFGSQRAGIVAQGTSKATIRTSMLSSNAIGVAKSGDATVDRASTVLTGNQVNLSGAKLALPTAPIAVSVATQASGE